MRGLKVRIPLLFPSSKQRGGNGAAKLTRWGRRGRVGREGETDRIPVPCFVKGGLRSRSLPAPTLHGPGQQEDEEEEKTTSPTGNTEAATPGKTSLRKLCTILKTIFLLQKVIRNSIKIMYAKFEAFLCHNCKNYEFFFFFWQAQALPSKDS